MAIISLRDAEGGSVGNPEQIDPAAAIGAQIRELRKLKGLTLQMVADEADISVGYLSQIERNQSKLPIGILKKLSDVLGVHMNWFFQGNIQSPPEEQNL